MKRTFCSRSSAQTCTLGRRLADRLPPATVVLLHGPLGAGKTTLVQGMAEALSIREPVSSPTFALAHEYRGGRLPLYHLDLYRLAGPDDVWEAGLAEYLEADGVTVIEWADRLGPLAPPDRLDVEIVPAGDEERTLIVEAHGDALEAALAALESGAC